MYKKDGLNKLTVNLQGINTNFILILLVLTQVPIAIKTSAEIACIGEVSNRLWKEQRSHAGVNISAIQSCN